MSHSAITVLNESRKLREEIRTRRDTLKRDLAQSQGAVAAIVAKMVNSITAAKQQK